MSKIYAVCFKDGGKCYYFKSDLEHEIDQYVIVDTEKGEQFAKIVGVNIEKKFKETIKDIIRIATDDDYEQHLKNLKDADKALKNCIKIVKELELEMNIISAQFTFERTQLIFNFLADERIDFRELAKRLAAIYHTRIELRQIGARDKAKEIGGIGICGHPLCCGTFLKQLETVTMNMAKNQNLALTPSKINGCCGRLLCCLAYEDEQYTENCKNMPSVGTVIKTPKGEGEIVGINVLERKVKVLIDGDKEEFLVDEL